MDAIVEEVKNLSENIISEIILHIPNLILAVIIFFAGLLLAKVIRKLTRRIILYLSKTINDKLINRKLAVDLVGSANFIGTSFFWIIIIFTVALISQILELNFLTKWFEGLIDYLPNVIAALLIIFTGYIAGKLISDLISSVLSRTGLTNGKQPGNIAKYIILVVSIILAIDQLGFDISFLTNIVSIILAALLFGTALAFGLGAKNSVSNILSSYYIQKTFKIGDEIKIDDTAGTIVNITATTVTIDTEAGQVVIPAKYFNQTKTLLIK